MSNRFVDIKAIFDKNKNILVPFWKCEFRNDNYFFDTGYNDTGDLIDAVYDSKKEEVIKPFEYRIPSKEEFSIGEKVVVEYDRNFRIEIVFSINQIETSYHNSSFEKASKYVQQYGQLMTEEEKTKALEAKIIKRVFLEAEYTFESGRKQIQLYVKKLKED